MPNRPNAATDIYNRHLKGTQFANSPGNNRLAVLKRMYQRVLIELAANRFKWSGMPDSIDVRFLEITLVRYALSVFFFDKDYDKFFAMQGGANGPLNMYNNPTAFQVVGNQFVGKNTISHKNAIPIWANYLRMPDLDIIEVYAHKLADLDLTVEINARNARRNKVIITPDNMHLSAQNVQRMIDQGDNNIQLSANGGVMSDLSFVAALDLGIHPDQVINNHILRTRIWNECMGLLGIENANQDKKERLVADEVAANDDQTNMMRHVNLNARQIAAEQINKRYGKVLGQPVTVEYHTDADKKAQQQLEQINGDTQERSNTE